MKKQTRIRLAWSALISYVALEAALLAGLQWPSERSWLDGWILYPSAGLLIITTYLATANHARRYLREPALALIIIIAASGLQEMDPARLNVTALAIHVAAIIWLTTSFMRYVSHIPPPGLDRGVLMNVSGIVLFMLETTYAGYLIHQAVPWLIGQERGIFTSLVLVTVAFGVIFGIVLRINVLNAPIRTGDLVGQGS